MGSKTETKKAPAPRLRFPGFEGGWEYQPLLHLSSLITRRTGTEIHTPMSITSGVGLVPQAEKFGREIAGAQYKSYFVIEKNDFAYNKSATKDYPEGFIAMHTEITTGAVPNSIFTCFRARPEKSVPHYLNYLFQGNLHGRWLRKFIAVGARANGALSVDTADLLNIPVPVPAGQKSLHEQAHIAAALSSLDAVIAAQTDKLTALRQHKQGLMQQLFPAEGERVPRLRFSEFEGAGEWEEKKLETLAKRGSGHTPSKLEAGYYNGGIKWISLADSNKLDSGKIEETSIEISELGIRNSSATLHPAGTVLLSRDAGVGKVAVMGIPMAVSQHFITWTCYPEKLDNWFLYQLLYKNKSVFERIATGSTIKTIGLPYFVDMNVYIPALPEQKRIAAALSSLDGLIAAQGERVAGLRKFKRGLMQGLFPGRGEE